MTLVISRDMKKETKTTSFSAGSTIDVTMVEATIKSKTLKKIAISIVLNS